jgi:hypothetical protein
MPEEFSETELKLLSSFLIAFVREASLAFLVWLCIFMQMFESKVQAHLVTFA